jgi:peptidoglycan hydrolase-like protein with peptidoglycan-binding domain
VAEGPHAMRRRRRVRWAVAGVAVLAVVGVGTAVTITRISAQAATPGARGPAPARTAEVVETDLAERETVTGRLGYGTEQKMTCRRPGTITALPATGAVLDRGSAVYEVDVRPVVLFFGALPLYRDVGPGVTDGPDVRLVEENLAALGFGGFGAPDEKFTSATEAAIKRWQKAHKLEQTGILPMTEVLVAPGPVRVGTITAQLGGDGAGEVLTYTSTTRSVSVDLTDAQRQLAAAGTKVTLTINGQRIPGTVTAVAPKDESGGGSGGGSSGEGGGPPGSGGGEASATATVAIDDLAAIGDLDSGSVDVEFTTGARAGVLAVPVGALLALAEGGYAVEVVEHGKRRLIAVETGLFADGLVEVSGDGLAAGMTVVTTS